MTEAPTLQAVDALLAAQRAAFLNEPYPSVAVRRDRLDRLWRMTRVHAGDIAEAISTDFQGRPWQETLLAEISLFEERYRHVRAALPQWMRRRRLPTTAKYGAGQNWVIPQPKGVIGILSPWNYPFDLCMGPALDAVAAGNRVIVKPSELTPTVASLLQALVEAHFDAEELVVVQGDAALAAHFSGLPWDHLSFTGSTAVGRQVAAAAAPRLTPLTLELGGKSPVIVEPDADLAHAATRIAWGKLFNAGQTCIAPDYVLLPRGTRAVFVDALVDAMHRHYPRFIDNPDYCSLISSRHYDRLDAMVRQASDAGATVLRVNPRGETERASTRRMSPRIVWNLPKDSALLREEIFGPVLPIIEVSGREEAIDFVRSRDRPLALYWFGTDRAGLERVLEATHAGGVTANDCLLHVSQVHQSFGGIGPSGQGVHHGQRGFEAFSHLKPLFVQAQPNVMGWVAPPYGTVMELAWKTTVGRRPPR